MLASLRVLVVGALPRSLVNFRGPLIQAMRERGHQVEATANGRDAETESRLREWGVAYHPIRLARAGMNPVGDARAFMDLLRLMRRVRPDIVLAYTIKPVVYGGLAARVYGGAKVFSMIEGLGRAFMPRESFVHGVSAAMARWLYRMGLPGSQRVFFLNPDDRDQFVEDGYVPAHQTVLLDGIGIDLEYYRGETVSARTGCRFLMIARLLKDKGVREYVAAAEKVREHHPEAKYALVGDLDENPSSIQQAELDTWQQKGLVDYAGYLGDIRPSIRQCQVYVLPSYYREGTPRTVLEAMAMGKPVVTTDAPGCRETVRPGPGGWRMEGTLKIGANGILIPPRDAEAVEAAMEWFLRYGEEIPAMGRESRRYAEERYDVRRVNETMLREMGL